MAFTYFISDCHLSISRPALLDCFTRFINEQAPQADALYILGDLFDYWLGDNVALEQPLCEVQNALLRLAQQLPVYFIHGNHDFLISQRFAQQCGLILLDQYSLIKLYGKNTLLTHGDLLCSDDRGYQCYRRIAQNPLTKATLNYLPAAIRRGLARLMNKISRGKRTLPKAQTVDVNQATVLKLMRQYATTRLIHGHTHKPAIHRLNIDGQKGQRIVLGDWYQHGSVLSVDHHNHAELKVLHL